jgi:hypothetical protein
MPKAPSASETTLDIISLKTGQIQVCILGRTPLVMNRLAEKAKRELLLPKGRKTTADKASNAKHNPPEEYRSSVHRTRDDKAPTRLLMPSEAFKGAMCTAALDLPGTKRTEIGRLCWVEGTHISIYGVPELFMTGVRSADMNRTPDIRTRAILPAWCAKVTITFVQPKLNATGVANLRAAAGLVCGVGDGRIEKGKLSFGQFLLCNEDDPEFKRIMFSGQLKAQDKALKNPGFFDEQSEELHDWWQREFNARGFEKAA